jgi:hypothetical protein
MIPGAGMQDLENEETRHFIESEIQRLLRRAALPVGTPGDDPGAPTMNDLRRRLDVMRSALDRVSEGSKGICVFCGREIPVSGLTPSGHWHLCSTCAPYYAREL